MILPITLLVGKNEMTKIIRTDPYVQHYIFEKETNPDAKLVWKRFERQVVDAVDRIVELAHGQRDAVITMNDWSVVEELVKFWAGQWPNEYQDFKTTIPDIRGTRNAGGYSKSKEIKYVGANPPRLEKMIKAIFPSQSWDKKFVNKLVKRFPLFKVGGEQNL